MNHMYQLNLIQCLQSKLLCLQKNQQSQLLNLQSQLLCLQNQLLCLQNQLQVLPLLSWSHLAIQKMCPWPLLPKQGPKALQKELTELLRAPVEAGSPETVCFAFPRTCIS